MSENNENHIKMELMNPKSNNKNIYLIYSIGLILVLIVIYFVNLFWNINKIYQLSITAKKNIISSISDIKKYNFDSASSKIKIGQINLNIAKQKLNHIHIPRIIPIINNKIKAGSNLLEAGINLSSALRQGLDIAIDIKKEFGTARSYESLTDKQKYNVLNTLAKSKPTIKQIYQKIRDTQDNLNNITETQVGKKIYSLILPIKKNLPAVISVLKIVSPTIEKLPIVLGLDQEKNYLLILQNDMELRPSGGLASTYGIIAFKNGTLTKFNLFDTYELDNKASKQIKSINAFKPIQKYLGEKYLKMIDSNWSADFSVSANYLLRSYYTESSDNNIINGVIAFTPNVFSDLLSILGDISIDDKVINSKNIREILDREVKNKSKYYYKKTERKKLFKKLGEIIKSELFKQQFNNYLKLLSYTEKWLKQKDILLYSTDKDIQDIIDKQNWSGKISENSEQDYLLLVDANMIRYNKIDLKIKRNDNYNIQMNNNNELISELTSSYLNTSNNLYKSYTRIYLPQNIEILRILGFAPGSLNIEKKFNKTIIGGLIQISPNKELAIKIIYKLPQKLIDRIIKKDSYSLYVQRQAGRVSNLSISLNFGKKINNFSPNNTNVKIINDKIFKLNTPLKTDLLTNITFKK